MTRMDGSLHGTADTQEGFPRRGGWILVTDVGSTTTKGLLLRRTEEGCCEVAAMADAPTTVEPPAEDVRIGVRAVLRKLEEMTGERLSRGGMPSVPYLTTSSAGGGLQMIVFGLTSTETGRIAENTALGAGGVVLRTMTVDDELSAVEKMARIRELHPDIVLMAGGTDGGDIAGVVRLAELLALADPQPKYREGRIPLVYCGNTAARTFVAEVLSDVFELHMAENVRPDLDTLNTGPAAAEVHRLFMDSVMERAPGYSALKEFTVSDILPTPAAVERILDLHGASEGGTIAMVDIGGATTDIFTRTPGGITRTVAANTGVSYSISNVLAETGLDRIMAALPPGTDPDAVRQYVFNKTLAPTWIPATPGEAVVERAVAAAGASKAWRDHLEILRRNSRVGFLDRRKRANRREFDDAFGGGDGEAFVLADIGTIIGAGGVVSHAGNAGALELLAEALLPSGVTRVLVDSHFRSPHAGILSTIDEQAALHLFEQDLLREAGFVVAPAEGFRRGEPALEVRDTALAESRVVRWGETLLLPRGGDLLIVAKGGTLLGGRREERISTALPVLVDCRGRGADFTAEPLRESDSGPLDLSGGPLPGGGPFETGPWELELRLPYEGEILVAEGDEVAPGTVVGRNRFEPPRLYVLDLNRIPGYDRHLTPEEVREGLLVAEGDRIETNAEIFRGHRGGAAGFDFVFRSPVRGLLARIERNGLLVLREIQDYDGEPHEVDVCGPLGIHPRHLRGHLKFAKGDFVGAGQTLASDVSRGIFVQAPTSGVLVDVSTRRGTVTITYRITPVPLLSHVRGRISRCVAGRSVTVSGSGTILRGAVGFGRMGSGPLADVRNGLLPGTVAFSADPVDATLLRRAAEAGVSGLVAPSIPASDWVGFCGRETPVALTGDEDIPFTLMLTSGFGRLPMPHEVARMLSSYEGAAAGLSGRTQVRAGAIRPSLILSDGS